MYTALLDMLEGNISKLTLLLDLTAFPISCSTTQLIVFHFLFPLFSIPLSQQAFSLLIGKTPLSPGKGKGERSNQKSVLIRLFCLYS